jgi:hypothetical protein
LYENDKEQREMSVSTGAHHGLMFNKREEKEGSE